MHYTLPARTLTRETHHVALIPPDSDGRPLVLLLHGRGSNPKRWAKAPMPKVLRQLGDRAPVVVVVDGGDHSYYHDREDGRWGSYVVDDVLADAQQRFDTDPDRVAIGGHSMGGFGALRIALEDPDRFCAVGGHQPAIWREPGETAPGAFDDAGDFERNDLIQMVGESRRPFGTARVWIDHGDQDPFVPGITALVAALRKSGTNVDLSTWPGGHGIREQRKHLDPMMRFYAKALAEC